MLGSPDDGARFAHETELLAALASENLPDMIAADRGAIACKIDHADAPPSYRFALAGRDIPSVAILIGGLIERLGTGANASIRHGLAALRAHLALDRHDAHGVEDLALTGAESASFMSR
jgi:hypothetical protein